MMSQEEITEERALSLDYKFSPAEIKYLAKFFRCFQDKIPRELEQFSFALEKAIYQNMSVDEVEKFFS